VAAAAAGLALFAYSGIGGNQGASFLFIQDIVYPGHRLSRTSSSLRSMFALLCAAARSDLDKNKIGSGLL
jgi:hypothetical protein